MNDGIEAELCTLKYSTVEQVATIAAAYPWGALLAKVDIESSYRFVPVHPLAGVGTAGVRGPNAAICAPVGPQDF